MAQFVPECQPLFFLKVAQFAPESLAQFGPEWVAQFYRNIHFCQTILPIFAFTVENSLTLGNYVEHRRTYNAAAEAAKPVTGRTG